MTEIIYPRSPYEIMDGWTYLPRYVDKIRLHLAQKLHPDYQDNFGKGFDASWLKAAGLTHEQFVDVVRKTVCDGQVCDWVHLHIKKSEAEKAQARAAMISHPKADDTVAQERLKTRKAALGISDRADITTFFAFIDIDEKRI